MAIGERNPLVDPSHRLVLSKDNRALQTTNNRLTFIALIRIAALIVLNPEAKRLVTGKVIFHSKFQVGCEIDENRVEWSSLTTSKKIILLVFGFIFGVMPFFARFAIRKEITANYHVKNEHASIALKKHLPSPQAIQRVDDGPISFLNMDDDEELDTKYAREIVRLKAKKEELIATQNRFKAFLQSKRDLWKLFCTECKNHPERLEPRKPNKYDSPSPIGEDMGDQWVRASCQNSHIISNIDRLVDFIASFDKLSRCFVACYQERLEAHPEEVKGFEPFCKRIFVTASHPIDIKRVDDSDEYLEQILNPLGLQTSVGELRLAWAGLTNEIPEKVNEILSPYFEHFVVSFENWYRAMTEGNWIKAQAQRLFKIKRLKDQVLNEDGLSELDRAIVRDSSILLHRRLHKDKFLNWQNVLQRAVESTKIQVIKVWKEQFFEPIEKLIQRPLEQEKIELELAQLLEKKDALEKYLAVSGSGVFVRLEELLEINLSPEI